MLMAQMQQCNLCGSQKFNHYLNCEHFSYVKCSDCGLVLQNPPPAQEEILDIYDASYFQYEIDNHNAFFNLMKLGLQDINFDQITRNMTEKRFLDIGSATGLLLNEMKQRGWDCDGVEICDESAEYARKNFLLNIHTCPLNKCRFPDNYFQIVHASHLIEHVPDPKDLLKEIYRILHPEGYLVLTTPNVDGLFVKFFQQNWRSAIAQHLYLFSKKTMRNYLKKSGFNIINQVSWGGIPIEISKGLVKQITDKWVKQLNLGDVMLFLATK